MRIIQGRALYTGKYGIFLNPNHSLHNLKDAKIYSLKLTTTNHPIWCIVALGTLKCCKLKDYFAFIKRQLDLLQQKVDDDVFALVRLMH